MVINRCDAFCDGNRFKVSTVEEGEGIDCLNLCGNCDALELSTCECTGSDRGNGAEKNYVFSSVGVRVVVESGLIGVVDRTVFNYEVIVIFVDCNCSNCRTTCIGVTVKEEYGRRNVSRSYLFARTECKLAEVLKTERYGRKLDVIAIIECVVTKSYNVGKNNGSFKLVTVSECVVTDSFEKRELVEVNCVNTTVFEYVTAYFKKRSRKLNGTKLGSVLKYVVLCISVSTENDHRAAFCKYESLHVYAVFECRGADCSYGRGNGDAGKACVVVECLFTDCNSAFGKGYVFKRSTALEDSVGNSFNTGNADGLEVYTALEYTGVSGCLNAEFNKRLGKVDGFKCDVILECLISDGNKLASLGKFNFLESYGKVLHVDVHRERGITDCLNACGNGDFGDTRASECRVTNARDVLLKRNVGELVAVLEELIGN